MEHTAFFVVGILLVIAALGVSFVGLRFERFPTSRALLAGGIGLFAALVLATTTAAVFNARDEQEQREAEQAEEAAAEQQEGEESASAEQTGGEGPSGASVQEQETAGQGGGAPAGGGGGGETLKLTSPDDGSTSFDPSDLEAKAGAVTIDYTNPSPVQHDVAIAQGSDVLDEGDLVTDGGVSTASADLQPGQYDYYCTVPGHREAGMEGTLTVK